MELLIVVANVFYYFDAAPTFSDQPVGMLLNLAELLTEPKPRRWKFGTDFCDRHSSAMFRSKAKG